MANTLTILFYPEMPDPATVVYQLCQHLGYRLSNNPTQPFDVAFKYFDATFFSADLLEVLNDIHDEVINAKSLDISKQKIGEIFAETFGYAITVNPVEMQGLGFGKSDINRLRDGQCIDLPIAAEAVDPYLVYQKYIDTETEGQYVDYGVPIYDGLIPIVLVKSRDAQDDFIGANTAIQLQHADEIFSPAEQQQLAVFVQELGLDYGELDVLRDRHDGRIYVVDVNNTPCEFPQGLTPAAEQELLEKLSDAFVPLLAKRL